MTMSFTYDELYRLSTAILSAIYGNNHASAAVCGMGAIMAIREENNRLRELNSKVCAMMEEMDKRSSAPIEDTDEYDEGNQSDEWQRLTASGQYHGIY